MLDNLNRLGIPSCDSSSGFEKLEDHKAVSQDGQTTVLFKMLANELIARIVEADAVIGCVAWLTHPTILRALSHKKGVSIIVQKEDFLRPDLGSSRNWSARLRELYGSLHSMSRLNFPGSVLRGMSTHGDTGMGGAVRCVGNYNEDKAPAFPRAHHKFVLFGKLETIVVHHAEEGLEEDEKGNWWVSEPAYEEEWTSFQPYEVWTGSFNFTKNAARSFENVIVSKDPNLIEAFYQEFAQVAALSEPLDWDSKWSSPEFRIGS